MKAPENQSAIEHFNLSVSATNEHNFDTAIAELDACLCANPNSYVAVCAWWRLAANIGVKYDFANRDWNDMSLEELVLCQFSDLINVPSRCILPVWQEQHNS